MKNEPAIQQLPQKSIFPPPKKRENNFLFLPRRSRVKIAPSASSRGTFSPPHTFPPFKRRISPPFPFPSRGKSCVGASPKKSPLLPTVQPGHTSWTLPLTVRANRKGVERSNRRLQTSARILPLLISYTWKGWK